VFFKKSQLTLPVLADQPSVCRDLFDPTHSKSMSLNTKMGLCRSLTPDVQRYSATSPIFTLQPSASVLLIGQVARAKLVLVTIESNAHRLNRHWRTRIHYFREHHMHRSSLCCSACCSPTAGDEWSQVFGQVVLVTCFTHIQLKSMHLNTKMYLHRARMRDFQNLSPTLFFFYKDLYIPYIYSRMSPGSRSKRYW
jgi:hypothetical protein